MYTNRMINTDALQRSYNSVREFNWVVMLVTATESVTILDLERAWKK